MAALREVSGRVISNGKGVEGVVVTDGYNVVRSDKKGRYSFESESRAKFVYISTPSGYQIPMGSTSAAIYHRLDPQAKRQRFNFDLELSDVDQTKHVMVVWADPQVFDLNEVNYVAKAASDLKALKESYGDMDIHGVVCGDIIAEISNPIFEPLSEAVASSEVPFFYVVGNHDQDQGIESNDAANLTFEQMYGPTYYSYNRGQIHYVVLNNSFMTGRGYTYFGYIEAEQLEWLKRDLESVEQGATVVVSMHISAYSREWRRREWGKEALTGITCNREALANILKPYNAHLLTAHTHYAENYVVSDRLMEHVHPPLSGLFWQSFWSMDGVPWGYAVYEIDGSEISWYYKPVGEGRDCQFAAYGVGENPMKMESITANVWNYDPSWRVEWFENGVLQGEMTQYTGYDPTICRDVEANQKNYRWTYLGAGPTEHLFFATPSSSDSKVAIRVTDRFGNQYNWTN